MKKFFIVLLCLILCVVVSCKTPKVKTGATVEYEESEAVVTETYEPVDSADAFEGTDFAPETSVDSSEVTELEVAEDSAVSETLGISENAELSGVSDGSDVSGGSGLSETLEIPEASETSETSEALVELSTETSEGETNYVEEASIEVSSESVPTSEPIEAAPATSDVSSSESDESTASESEALVQEEPGEIPTTAEEQADANEVEVQPVEPQSVESQPTEIQPNSESVEQIPDDSPSDTTSNNVESVVEIKDDVLTNSASEVPTAFLDKVVYYAKLYGSKALDFAKHNIILSLGFLSIAIGVIWLLVDLIKFIVKSIKTNDQDYDEDSDIEIEEPEINKAEVYHPVKEAKAEAKTSPMEKANKTDKTYSESKVKAEQPVKEKTNSSAKNKSSEQLEFQDEDDFLRSLLNMDEDL